MLSSGSHDHAFSSLVGESLDDGSLGVPANGLVGSALSPDGAFVGTLSESSDNSSSSPFTSP